MKNQKEKTHEEEIQDQWDDAGMQVDFKRAEMAAKKKKFCRFTMFVKLWPGIVWYWPGLVRVWCFRGDKFTDDHRKQIRNLLNHAKKNIHRYCIIELYDNSYSHDNEKRIILEYKDGVFVKNNLEQYQQSLKDFPLPEQFKS